MSSSGAILYQEFYAPDFLKNRDRYSNMRKGIDRRIDEILVDPFSGTEILEYKEGKDQWGHL